MRMPQDGVVKLYGTGSPHIAFRTMAGVRVERTGTEVETVAGPERAWSADAQRDADILYGTSEQSMTAFLETCGTFDHETVEPIYLRPTMIAMKTGNPRRHRRIQRSVGRWRRHRRDSGQGRLQHLRRRHMGGCRGPRGIARSSKHSVAVSSGCAVVGRRLQGVSRDGRRFRDLGAELADQPSRGAGHGRDRRPPADLVRRERRHRAKRGPPRYGIS